MIIEFIIGCSIGLFLFWFFVYRKRYKELKKGDEK